MSAKTHTKGSRKYLLQLKAFCALPLELQLDVLENKMTREERGDFHRIVNLLAYFSESGAVKLPGSSTSLLYDPLLDSPVAPRNQPFSPTSGSPDNKTGRDSSAPSEDYPAHLDWAYDLDFSSSDILSSTELSPRESPRGEGNRGQLLLETVRWGHKELVGLETGSNKEVINERLVKLKSAIRGSPPSETMEKAPAVDREKQGNWKSSTLGQYAELQEEELPNVSAPSLIRQADNGSDDDAGEPQALSSSPPDSTRSASSFESHYPGEEGPVLAEKLAVPPVKKKPKKTGFKNVKKIFGGQAERDQSQAESKTTNSESRAADARTASSWKFKRRTIAISGGHADIAGILGSQKEKSKSKDKKKSAKSDRSQQRPEGPLLYSSQSFYNELGELLLTKQAADSILGETLRKPCTPRNKATFVPEVIAASIEFLSGFPAHKVAEAFLDISFSAASRDSETANSPEDNSNTINEPVGKEEDTFERAKTYTEGLKRKEKRKDKKGSKKSSSKRRDKKKGSGKRVSSKRSESRRKHRNEKKAHSGSSKRERKGSDCVAEAAHKQKGHQNTPTTTTTRKKTTAALEESRGAPDANIAIHAFAIDSSEEARGTEVSQVRTVEKEICESGDLDTLKGLGTADIAQVASSFMEITDLKEQQKKKKKAKIRPTNLWSSASKNTTLSRGNGSSARERLSHSQSKKKQLVATPESTSGGEVGPGSKGKLEADSVAGVKKHSSSASKKEKKQSKRKRLRKSSAQSNASGTGTPRANDAGENNNTQGEKAAKSPKGERGASETSLPSAFANIARQDGVDRPNEAESNTSFSQLLSRVERDGPAAVLAGKQPRAARRSRAKGATSNEAGVHPSATLRNVSLLLFAYVKLLKKPLLPAGALVENLVAALDIKEEKLRLMTFQSLLSTFEGGDASTKNLLSSLLVFFHGVAEALGQKSRVQRPRVSTAPSKKKQTIGAGRGTGSRENPLVCQKEQEKAKRADETAPRVHQQEREVAGHLRSHSAESPALSHRKAKSSEDHCTPSRQKSSAEHARAGENKISFCFTGTNVDRSSSYKEASKHKRTSQAIFSHRFIDSIVPLFFSAATLNNWGEALSQLLCWLVFSAPEVVAPRLIALLDGNDGRYNHKEMEADPEELVWHLADVFLLETDYFSMFFLYFAYFMEWRTFVDHCNALMDVVERETSVLWKERFLSTFLLALQRYATELLPAADVSGNDTTGGRGGKDEGENNKEKRNSKGGEEHTVGLLSLVETKILPLVETLSEYTGGRGHSGKDRAKEYRAAVVAKQLQSFLQSKMNPLEEQLAREAAQQSQSDLSGQIVSFAGSMLGFLPETMAKAIATLDLEMLKSIPLCEFAQERYKLPESSPKYTRMLDHFNTVTLWVATEIIKKEHQHHRMEAIIFWIKVAKLLFSFCAYNAMFAVLLGLNQVSVSRLKATWASVPRRYRSLHQTLADFLDSAHNYRKYRQQLQLASLPCVPFLAVLTKDVFFVEDNHQTFSRLGAVNLHKMAMLWKVVGTISHFKNGQYAFSQEKDVEDLKNLLRVGPKRLAWNSEALYEASLSVESFKRDS